MTKIKGHVPNILTFANLMCGCIAIAVVLQGRYEAIPWALLFVILASIFDFFDGMSARLLKVQNPIGKDLDSLADCVSFGVVPSAVLFVFLQENISKAVYNEFWQLILPFTAFLIAVFSAWRLAKFNNDSRQTESFIGLATPANTLFWVSLCSGLSIRAISGDIYVAKGLIYTLLGLILVSCYLLMAELPMFSLKVKTLNPMNNIKRYFLVFILIILVPFFGYLSIAGTVVAYVILSLFDNTSIEDFATNDDNIDTEKNNNDSEVN